MKKIVKIGNKEVGEGKPTFIIAEAGSNHNQKLDKAKELIDIAAEAGVDAIKFQLFKAETLYPKNTPVYEILKGFEFLDEWLGELFDYSKELGLLFLASPFDTDAIDSLINFGASAIKIASSELTNFSLLKYASEKNKPLLVSVGMSDISDIAHALEVISSTGNNEVVILQCTALYPTQPQDVHLNVINRLKKTFCVPVGFSDHTISTIIPAAAVALGACVIEKHITPNRQLGDPDHFYATEPDELKEMVKAIREVELSLGSSYKEILPQEKELSRRTSIFAKVDIPKNTVISKDSLVIKRPLLGIKPQFYDSIIGMRAKKDIKKDVPIKWDFLKTI